MRILGHDEAVECYRAEWARRHPATAPPELYPDFPEDPNWVEASGIMDDCWARARLGIGVSPREAAEFSAPQWTSGPGIIGCPNGHGFSMDHNFCPVCGLGPVPEFTRHEAQDDAVQLGVRAGLHFLRTGLG